MDRAASIGIRPLLGSPASFLPICSGTLTTTRTYGIGIVQMSVGKCFPLLFSPSFFAYMLYDLIIQLPPGGQGHPYPPSVFPTGIC